MANEEIIVGNDQRHSWLYGKLNYCENVKSSSLISVPSLRLTEEFFDYFGNQVKFAEENVPNVGNEIVYSSGVNMVSLYEEDITFDDMYRQVEVPDLYYFPNMEVALFSSESLYNDSIKFRKCSLHYSYEACAKLNIFNRSPKPVVFKILCNRPEETRAEPCLDIVTSQSEQRFMIYLINWKEEHASRLKFKIQVAQLDDDTDTALVWRNPNAVISCTPTLRCVVINEEVEPSEQEEDLKLEVSEPKDEMDEDLQITVDSNEIVKHRSVSLFRQIFRPFAETWRRLRHKGGKKKIKFTQ